MLVDDYLDQFARRHPSIAAGNGLHAHDGLLEDFSAGAVAAEIDWLRAVGSRLDALDPGPLTPDERVDRRILQGVVDGWLLDLDTVRTWTRNPMIYASAISDGVHNLMTMESSPAAARMQQVASKLQRRAAPARSRRATNIRQPPRVFVERAIVMFRGASDLIAHDLPLAFAGRRRSALRRLTSAADAARKAIDDYATELETNGAARRRPAATPSARRTSRRGTAPRS